VVWLDKDALHSALNPGLPSLKTSLLKQGKGKRDYETLSKQG